MAELSDKEIIRKIQNGEINQYSYIVKRYSSLVLQFVKKKLFNKDDADDLVQNAFISFYKSLNRFNTDKPVKPYLFQIVQNELRMYFRSFKKSQPLDENIAVSEEKSDLSMDDFKFLNAQEKIIFKHINDGYTYSEIANIFKKPLNTIKSIVRRTRLKLTKIYEKT